MSIPTNSRVMHTAHYLQIVFPNQEWSELVKLAWHYYYLRRMLQNGIVKFVYLKVNNKVLINAVRHARGTLNNELIPEDKKPKGSPTYEPNWGTMPYFDLDKMEWRSFRIDCLRDIEGYIALNNVELNKEEE